MNKWIRWGLMACTAAMLASCATEHPSNPQDPYEPFNRAVFNANLKADKYVIRPAARVYNAAIPAPMQTGVSNFENNIAEPYTMVNDLLQAKPIYFLADTLRFVINTTLGIGGLFDVAKHLNLPPHTNTFGDTLAYWGGDKPARYLVLPLFGPSTFRSAFGMPFQIAADPTIYLYDTYTTLSLETLGIINVRASLLSADPFLAQAFDPYVLVRSAYLQRRKQQLAENHWSYQKFQRNYQDNLALGIAN